MQAVQLLAVVLLSSAVDHAQGSRLQIQGVNFVKDGHHVVLSGANTAWIDYGNDFGNHNYQRNRDRFLHRLDVVKNAGGNSMRTWIHVHGATSPHFDNNGYVTGLDRDGTFLSDFKQYLDDARSRNILIFPCLWNGAVVQHQELLHGLITDTKKLQSYLDKALIPWVNATKDHPALGGWDIINEMEGFMNPEIHDSDPCFDTTFLRNSGTGWAGKLYSAKELQGFVNWQVDAILRTDSHALVSAGSWSQKSQSDKFGDHNLYSDQCLVKAGGKQLGKVNFYQTHSYSWQGAFSSDSTFLNNATDFGLDKPIVVGEFMQSSGAGMSSAQLFTYCYEHGYAGCWIWSDESEDIQASGIRALNSRTDHGVIHLTL